MAYVTSDAGSKIINTAAGTVAAAIDIEGGYFSAPSLDVIPDHAKVAGALCYVTGNVDDPVNKFYQYNGTSWEEVLMIENKVNSMQTADEARIARYNEYNQEVAEHNQKVDSGEISEPKMVARPYNEDLFNVLKAKPRVYEENSNYGGISVLGPTTGTGDERVFNPWGFDNLEDMFDGMHWPLEWNGTTITEATDTNKSGWYKVIYDNDGNAVSYHPAMGTVPVRYDDGNIRVPLKPRDSRDAASKNYVDSMSVKLASGIKNYELIFRGANGFGSKAYSSSATNSTIAARTDAGEVLCKISNASDKLAAVNKEYLETSVNASQQSVLDQVNNQMGLTHQQEGNELIINDIASGVSTVTVHTEPGAAVIASAPIIYYSQKQSVSNLDAYAQVTSIRIKPPKHQKYRFSCSFANPSNRPLRVLVRLDDQTAVGEAKTSEASGLISFEIDLTKTTYKNQLYIRLYGNSSSQPLTSAEPVVFSDIKLELADYEIKQQGSETLSYNGTADANGNLTLKVPNWSPIIVYNINDYDMEVAYSRDFTKILNNISPSTLTIGGSRYDLRIVEEGQEGATGADGYITFVV